jgi:UDP-N-acetylglucosamine 2-epimerase (non-hydrolysing)
MKVVTLVGTRPELIKLSCVIPKLDSIVNHILVHTGQNYDYELNGIFFEDLNIRKPDYFLDVATSNVANTIANVISKTDEILEKERPDAFLIYGDTNSCLSVIAAKKRKIPIFHMEAGNRCFDERVPEEVNRRLIDHLSDINLVITEQARQHLLREGLPEERIFKVGSSMFEVIDQHRSKIENSKILDKLSLEKDSYFLISTHREENVDEEENLLKIWDMIASLGGKFGKKVIVSLHPRTRQRLQKLGKNLEIQNVIFSPPFSFSEYVALQINAYCVISDSGTLSEEASMFGFPAIILRETHERPEGIDAGTVMLNGSVDKETIFRSIEYLRSVHSSQDFSKCPVQDYCSLNVGDKVTKIILGYTPYVNNFIWKKDRG